MSDSKPSAPTLNGDASLPGNCSLLDFWRWAFSDQCDDDIKGIFAEWMIGVLLGLHKPNSRRVSWADSDFVAPSKKRIEVKASSIWQSWKLVNPDGTRKPPPEPVVLNPSRIRFGGLQARTAERPTGSADAAAFKSDIYVFCMQTQENPDGWDAWNLRYWEFYVMSREELAQLGVVHSVSLAALRSVRRGMTARELQDFVLPHLRNDA